jgi:hypothetical protein
MKEKLKYWYYTMWYACYGRPRWFYSLRAYLRSVRASFKTPREIAIAKEFGCVLDAEGRAIATKQAKCNHIKGGIWRRISSDRVDFTPGSSGQYAVIKHKHIHGDVWVECLRCGRKWKPPMRKEFKTDREFYKAVEEYEQAVNFPTNNISSSSVICQFRLNGSVDAGTEYVRKQLANS